jgi:Ubiquitin carboxyl-terminal hydrolase
VNAKFDYPLVLDMTPFLEGNAWSDERASARETTTNTTTIDTNADTSTTATSATGTTASSSKGGSGKHHGDKSKAADKQHQQQQQQQAPQVTQLKSDNGAHVWLHQAWNDTIIQLQKEHVQQQQQQLPLDTSTSTTSTATASVNGAAAVQQQQQSAPQCNGTTQQQQQQQQQHATVADDDGNLYDLFSVVIHKGNAYSGHYHAYIRDCLNEGQWCAPVPVPHDKLAEFISGTGRHSDMSTPTTATTTTAATAADSTTEGNSSKSNDDAVTVLQLVHKQLAATPPAAKCMSIKQLMKALDKDAAKTNSSSADSDVSSSVTNWRALALAHTAAKSSMSLDDVAVAHALLNIIKSRQDIFAVVSTSSSTDSIVDANTLLSTTLLLSADVAALLPTTATMTRTASQESLLPTVKDKLTNHLEWSYRSAYGLLHVDERDDDTSTSTNGTSQTVAADSNPTDTTATTTATVNGVSSDSSDTSKQHDDNDDMTPLHIDVETAVSQRYGKWFNFDDRSVTPISLLELQKPFEGKLIILILLIQSYVIH